jgi:hypothetical protein
MGSAKEAISLTVKVEMNASDNGTIEHGIGLLAVNHRRENGVGGLAVVGPFTEVSLGDTFGVVDMDVHRFFSALYECGVHHAYGEAFEIPVMACAWVPATLLCPSARSLRALSFGSCPA